jgi:hypothetical protein
MMRGVLCIQAGEEDLQLVVEHSFDGGLAAAFSFTNVLVTRSKSN